jgi:hypothetical protein
MIFLIWKRIFLGLLLPRKEMSLDQEEDFSLPRRGISATWKRILATWKRIFRYIEENFPIPRRIISDTGKRMFLYLEEDVPLPGENIRRNERKCSLPGRGCFFMFLYRSQIFHY